MNRLSLFVVGMALGMAGCGAEDDAAGPPSPGPVLEAQDALVDASGLYPVGPLGRPAPTFDPGQGLTLANIAGTQVGSEGLVAVGTLGSSLQRYQSPHWRVQRRVPTGDLQVVGREEQWTPPVENPALDPTALQAAAKARVVALGVPASEILEILQRRTRMMASEDMESRLHSHVTFVERGFHGIPARGSHASVVHDRAGAFRKLTLHWRPVAPDVTGNQWGTSMTPAQITARANQELAQRGLLERPAELRYAYAPKSLNDDGTTTFALRCIAHVDGLPDGQDRPREIEIPLDP